MKNVSNERNFAPYHTGQNRTQMTPPAILVVDDEEHMLRLYEKELSEDGYQVKTATGAEDALKIAQNGQVDLVVLDIKLEGKNGLEILSDFRRINKDLPIILNSAYSTYKSDFQSWLADAYLVKSSNLEELKKTIRELVNF
ncbi:MAG: response regulator [candidate division Zixibacteria bacterium]|nr:response regulator [candidate division Zixibacteria bacterium]